MQFSQPRILNQKFCIIDQQMLGKGSTGDVFLGFYRSNPHNKVAIKVINLKQIKNQVTRYLLACEIAALNNLGKLQNTSHENVVKLHDVLIIDTYIYLVMELLEGKTLAQYIKDNPNGMPFQEAIYLFIQILQGYIHISSKKIVHRDLKPDNILFKSKSQVDKKLAIIDFGYCEMQQVPNKPQMHYNVGSPKYMSPQAYKTSQYNQKSDVWALGIIFYEMLAGKTCDVGMNMQQYLQMVEMQGIPLPSSMNKLCQQILIEMLQYNPQNRSQCSKILNLIKRSQRNLMHHKSQALIYRHIMNQSNSLNDKQARKPNNMIMQSMIVSNDKIKCRQSLDNFAPQEKQSYINNQSHNIVHNSPAKLENVHLYQSVRQIVHKKQFGMAQPQYSDIRPSIQKQTPSKIQNPNYMVQMQVQQRINKPNFVSSAQKVRDVIMKNQQNFMMNSHHNQHYQNKKVFFNFVNNQTINDNMMKSHYVPEGQSEPSTQTSVLNPPVCRENLIYTHRVLPSNVTEPSKQYFSPQRQPIKQVRQVQYFTQTKVVNTPHYQINPNMGRPLVNMQPNYGSGQMRLSYHQVHTPHIPSINNRNQYNQRYQQQHQHHLSMIQGYSN